MKTWSEEGMRMQRIYLAKETETLNHWNRILKHHSDSATRAKNMVEFLENSIAEFKREIAEQEDKP